MQKPLKDMVSETLRILESRATGPDGCLNLAPSQKPKCPKCNDTQVIQVYVENRDPRDPVPVRFCECREESKRQKLIERYVPNMWKGLRIENLNPWEYIEDMYPIDKQAEVIKDLKSAPFAGHSFFGPSGTGKSRYLHCLLQEAIIAGKDVFFSKMAKLIFLMREEELGRLPQERWIEIIDIQDLKRRSVGNQIHIFLDEIDKINISDDVYLKFLEIVDYIYENRHVAVLSMCTNLSLDGFVSVWGEAIARRIMTLTHVHVTGMEK